MTFEEPSQENARVTPVMARELLGVSDTVSADALRRAYLRRIKKHSPERDPEGFRATREAYECLSSLTERERDPETPTGAQDEIDREEALPARAPTDQDVGTRIDASWAIEDRDERLAALRALREEFSNSREVLLVLSDELLAGGDRAASLDLLREGIEQGMPELDTELFRAHADALTDDELGRLRASPGRDRAWMLMNVLLVRQAYEEAADVAIDAIQTSHRPAAYWLDVFFRLVEDEQVGAARRVLLAIQKCTEDRQDAAALPSPIKLRLVLAAELSAVAKELPDHLAASIAAGLRSGAAQDIEDALEAYGRDFPNRGRIAREALDRDAPQLAARFGAVLAAPARRPFMGSPIWLGAVVILGLLRLISMMTRGSDRDARRTEELYLRTDAIIEIRPNDSEPMLCVGDRGACRLLSDATEALDDARCSDALSALERFDERGRSEGTLRAMRSEIDERAVSLCFTSPSPSFPLSSDRPASHDTARETP